MESKQRKNTTRRLLTLTSKHDRFISAYLKAKYPEVYGEADEFFTQLNKLYPDKRDLRKTIEFLRITAGIKNLNEYYYRNKISKRLEKNHTADNMVLEIPLLNQNTLTNNQNEEVNESPLVIPEEVNVHANELPLVIPEEVNVHANEPPLVIPEEVNVHANEPPLVIPDHLYEDLIQELRKDPDLRAIFKDMNDVDLSQEHQPIPETIPEVENINHLIQELCEDSDTHNVLNIDEPTPLEWELYTLGY